MKKSVLMLLSLFMVVSTWSQTISWKIDSISIKGNKRSKTDLILNELTFVPGDVVDTTEVEQSIQFIRNRELFSQVEWNLVELSDTSTILDIEVRDKWTLYPILYFSGTGTSAQYRAGVMDWNFLGRGIYFLASYGLKTEDGLKPKHIFELEADYQRIGGSRWGIDFGAYSKASTGYILQDNLETGSYESNSHQLNLGMSYNHKNLIIPNFSLGYQEDLLSDITNENLQKSTWSRHRLFKVTTGIKLDLLQVVDHRNKGVSASFEYSIYRDLSRSTYSDLKATVQLHALSRNGLFFAILQGKTNLSNASELLYKPTFESFLRGSTGKAYFYNHIVGGNLELGITPIQKKWLTLDLVLVTDLGYGWNRFSENNPEPFRYRYGSGIRFSWPSMKGMLLSVDVVKNEYGQFETLFGAVRFLD